MQIYLQKHLLACLLNTPAMVLQFTDETPNALQQLTLKKLALQNPVPKTMSSPVQSSCNEENQKRFVGFGNLAKECE